MTENLQPGDVVDVLIRGARVMDPKPGHDHVLTLGYAEPQPGVFATFDLRRPAADTITVTRVAPAEWPPQPGDVWRDRLGTVHFGVAYAADPDDEADYKGTDNDGSRVVLVASGGDYSCRLNSRFYRPEYVNQQYGPLTLLHRLGQGGDDQ